MRLRCSNGSRVSLIAAAHSIAVALFLICPSATSAQSSANVTGNGGRHTIQGRIYTSSGRRSEIGNLKVRLVNYAAGDLTTSADANGSFSFRNLNAGSYVVVVADNEGFEDFRESVFIDDLGGSIFGSPTTLRPPTRIMNVQVFLKPKATEATAPAKVISAKWAHVPKDAIQHLQKGIELMRDNKTAEAEAEFRKSLAIAPGFGPAHTELGILQQRTGKLDAAVASWKTALKYDENDFDAHLNLGVAFLNLKQYPECENELISAAFLDKAAVRPHYYLGMLYVVKDDLNVARKAFETARDLKGGKALPAIHKYLGRVYMAMSLNKEAIRELQAYLDLMPSAQDADRVRKDISDIKSKSN